MQLLPSPLHLILLLLILSTNATTLIVHKFKTGLIIATDTRTSAGDYIVDRGGAKIDFVTDLVHRDDGAGGVSNSPSTTYNNNSTSPPVTTTKRRRVGIGKWIRLPLSLTRVSQTQTQTHTPTFNPNYHIISILRTGQTTLTQRISSILQNRLTSLVFLKSLKQAQSVYPLTLPGSLSGVNIEDILVTAVGELKNVIHTEMTKTGVKQNIKASLILAGISRNEIKPGEDNIRDVSVIVEVTVGGSFLVHEKFCTSGSGSVWARGVIEHYKKESDGVNDFICEGEKEEEEEEEEEVFRKVEEALKCAMNNDPSSGGVARIVVMKHFDQAGRGGIREMLIGV